MVIVVNDNGGNSFVDQSVGFLEEFLPGLKVQSGIRSFPDLLQPGELVFEPRVFDLQVRQSGVWLS